MGYTFLINQPRNKPKHLFTVFMYEKILPKLRRSIPSCILHTTVQKLQIFWANFDWMKIMHTATTTTCYIFTMPNLCKPLSC